MSKTSNIESATSVTISTAHSTARDIATAIARQLQQAGFMAVFAGGCVRDQFLDVEPKDFDIATNARPEQVIAVFSQTGDTVLTVGVSFGVVIVVRDGEQIEIASFRGDGKYGDGRRPDEIVLLDGDPLEALQQDAARRDLTVNAMFYDPVADKLYDFFGGRRDIADRTLRAVGDAAQRFAEDRLRMLRVARFAAKLGFTISPELMDALKQHAASLKPGSIVSYERVAKELEGILLSKDPVTGMQILMDSGLLAEILPEMMPLIGDRAMGDPIWHPEGLAWTHTMLVLGEAAKEPAADKSFAFMLGVLLHDIAKPETMTTRQETQADGTVITRISNRGHAEKGVPIARAITNRLKLSSDTTHRVTEIVRMHMQMHDFNDPAIKRSKLVSLMQRDDIMDLIRMQHADVMGTTRSLEDRMASSHRAFYLALLEEMANDASPARRLNAAPLIDGSHVKAFGFKPGPVYRVIKDAALEAQHDGEFADDAGALAWLAANADRFSKGEET